jgi:hypothetical protein
MQILFRCRHCFGECRTNPARDPGTVTCKSCGKAQSLRYTESHKVQNLVDQCVVCAQRDFYVRDDTRKALGLVYLLAGLAGGYFTYGVSLVAGGAGFYWYFCRYPKLTICYHCYAKYRNCRLNPQHGEYDLRLTERFEREIRNDRTSRDFH